MADVYTPNPANHPTSITLPEDGDPKAASSVRVALAALADMAGGSAGGFGSGTLVDMAAVTGALVGHVYFVPNMGLYCFSTTEAASADGFFVVTGVGGKWVHFMRLAAASLGTGFAAVGPVAGGGAIFAATPPGRINFNLIPYGHYVTNFLAAGADTSVDSTPVTPTAGDLISIGTITVGTLAVNDIVTCQLPMIGFNTGGDFCIGTYISFDDGATYACISPNVGGGAIIFEQTPAGVARDVSAATNFVKQVTVAGICKVQFKFGRVAAGTTNVWWGPVRIRTERP